MKRGDISPFLDNHLRKKKVGDSPLQGIRARKGAVSPTVFPRRSGDSTPVRDVSSLKVDPVNFSP